MGVEHDLSSQITGASLSNDQKHFKGGKYEFIHSAFDSETQEHMVVYQALYGDQAYWVRPEDMFFGKVTRDGRTFNRFTEIDK